MSGHAWDPTIGAAFGVGPVRYSTTLVAAAATGIDVMVGFRRSTE